MNPHRGIWRGINREDQRRIAFKYARRNSRIWFGGFDWRERVDAEMELSGFSPKKRLTTPTPTQQER